MKCVELNPKGNFDPWEPRKLQELKNAKIDDRLGQNLLFENKNIKVWEVVLWPGERLPFRKIGVDFNFTSMTQGLAVSRWSDGKISLIKIDKGDSMFMGLEGNEATYDFENIGESILFLHALEFKPIVEKTEGLKVTSYL